MRRWRWAKVVCWGVGLGHGRMKELIPDVHADFIFAVAGEELGLIGALALLGLFFVYHLARMEPRGTKFITVCCDCGERPYCTVCRAGHDYIGSTLHLLPTKGMTLPLVSYGGSSLVAMGFGLGMVLALLRKRPEEGVRL
jgi:cell division protein FtsW